MAPGSAGSHRIAPLWFCGAAGAHLTPVHRSGRRYIVLWLPALPARTVSHRCGSAGQPGLISCRSTGQAADILFCGSRRCRFAPCCTAVVLWGDRGASHAGSSVGPPIYCFVAPGVAGSHRVAPLWFCGAAGAHLTPVHRSGRRYIALWLPASPARTVLLCCGSVGRPELTSRRFIGWAADILFYGSRRCRLAPGRRFTMSS